MRNRSPEGKLTTLPPEKRQVLHRWFSEGLKVDRIVARLKAELGVASSSGAVSNYYQRRWGLEKLGVRAVCNVVAEPLQS